jgi:hypothetical protein
MTTIETATWSKRIAYAMMSALVTATLIVVLALIWRAFFSDPPVHVTSLDKPFETPICPGDQFVINNRVTVDRPVVLFFYVSVMDEQAQFNINDTQISFPGRPHPKPSTFHQLLPWTVPDLLPGNYVRSIAVRGTDGDENPLFLLTPFEVRSDCP